MSIMKFLVTLVVLALVIGGALTYMGIIKINSNGPQLVEPKAPDVDDYTKADTSFFANQWDTALIAYHKALDDMPNDDRAAAAMYRCGKCCEELNKTDDAIAAYKAFVDKFPNDSNARKANERIEYLKDSNNKS